MTSIQTNPTKTIAKPEAKPKPEAKAKPAPKVVEAKPEAKSKVEAKAKAEAKVKPEPKVKEPKPVIIREIIKEISRPKRAPTAFNLFMGEHTKNNKMGFKEAINLWNEQKPKKV